MIKKGLILFVVVLFAVLSCKQHQESTASTEVESTKAPQDTSFIAKQQIKSRQKLEALYNEPILIDTVFKVGPDSLFVHFEHYCLKDSEFIVPPSSYEIAGDFKTYNFASKLEVSSHTEVIRKETFDDLLFERLRNYGVLMMPSIALVSENDKDLIRVHYSITIPGTDVGTSATLYLSRLGERRISQY